MDLNRLYFQQQLSSMRASGARDRNEQADNQDHADQIGRKIHRYQRDLVAPAAATWAALRTFSASRLPNLAL